MRSTVRLTRDFILLTGLLAGLSRGAVGSHDRGQQFPADRPSSGHASAPAVVRLASLSVSEREEISTIARSKPSVDLEIPFEVDSEVLSDAGNRVVAQLGKALTSKELAGTTFLLAGHTDGLESDTYSQELSELRADAVKSALVTSFGIPGADLVTVGYGSSRLRNTMNPLDPANDRVQVVSMEDGVAAK